MARFSVTFETFTPESIECGDADDRGFLGTDLTLRDAIAEIGGIGHYAECDSSHGRPRWITFHNVTDGTRDYFENGTIEDRALHIPDHVSDASAKRIARLCGAYGYA